MTKKITLALSVLAITSVSFAQTTVATPTGVLGQKYVEVSVGTQDVSNLSGDFYDAGLTANLPVTSSLDLSVGYTYGWVRSGVSGHSNTLLGAATFYAPMGSVKPFLAGALGYQWTRVGPFRDRGGVWGVAGGVEIPFGNLALTPRIIYTDDFESGSSRDFTYELEANYWLSATTAVHGSIGRTEVDDSPLDATNYRLGLRFKF